MNIYAKIQKARCEFQEKPLKKSGYNTYSNYPFFELKDVQPTINALLDKYNLCSIISFGTELATLTIINSEVPEEKIVFTSPMSTAKLKACHEVQNLGAVETYLRRYLWFSAFEIVENDGLDATTGKDEPQKPSKTKANVNLNKIEKLLATKEVNQEAFIQFAKSTYKINDLNQLNDNQAKELIGMLQAKPDKHA